MAARAAPTAAAARRPCAFVVMAIGADVFEDAGEAMAFSGAVVMSDAAKAKIAADAKELFSLVSSSQVNFSI